MAARKNPLWLIIIFSFLVVYCGVHLNLSTEDWQEIFKKNAGPVSGNLLFAATNNGIHAFKFNGVTGALTELAGSPYGSGNNYTKMGAYGNNGNTLIASKMSNDLHSFKINSDGTLTYLTMSSFPQANYLTVNPAETIVYASNQGAAMSSAVTVYAIDPISKSLSPVAGSPFAGGCSPQSGVLTPDNKFFYTGGVVFSNLYLYSVQAGGNLAIPSPSPSPSYTISPPSPPFNPSYLAVHPSSNYLYLASATGGPYPLSQYNINADGSVTPGSPGFYAFGAANYASRGLAVSPVGDRLFTVYSDGAWKLLSYPIYGSGVLDQTNRSVLGTQNSPHDLVVDSSGSWLFVASDDSAGSGVIQIFLLTNGNMQEILPSGIINSKHINSMILVKKS